MSIESKLSPGTTIELSDLTDLPRLENLVALHIDPEMTQREVEAWQGRPNIREFIRPPKFNGTIANVSLTVMGEPYNRLMDSHERGLKLQGIEGGIVRARNFERTGQASKSVLSEYVGFVLLADAKSSGRGTVDQIKTELWYMPTRRVMRGGKVRKAPPDADGDRSVNRVVAKPVLSSERFTDLIDESKRIAFTEFRRNLRAVRTQPIRN